MVSGKVVGIYIAHNRGEPTMSIDQVHVIPGMGIEGDRFFDYVHNPEYNGKSGHEITLIEMEAIVSMNIVDEIEITPDQTRRNIVTQGISLNKLVNEVFTIGEIKLRGTRLCEPCQYLANKTDQRVLVSMTHRGGLRAEILSEGIIHVNDAIILSNEEIL